MANKSDFNVGSKINGRVAYRNPSWFNGQVVFDKGIQPMTKTCKYNVDDSTQIVVSGTMGYLSEPSGEDFYQFNPIVASAKGADALYIIASKEKGAYVVFDKTNNDIDYFYYNDGESFNVIALEEGMRIYLRAQSAITIGQELCPVDEYMVAPTVAGVAGYSKIFIAESSAAANELVLCRVRRNGLSS